jgi:DNA-binding XRE family transcriptional regulator
MNLTTFLNAEHLSSQAALARELGVSPQSLKQYLERDSNTFRLCMAEHYPEWTLNFRAGEWHFSRQTDPLGGYRIHKWSKDDLLIGLDLLNSNPAAYSFVAATNCDPLDIHLDREHQDLVFSRPGSSEVFAKFPYDQVPHLVRSLDQAEEE